MSDDPGRTKMAVQLMVEELEAVARSERQQRHVLEQHALRRRRLASSIEPMLGELLTADAERFRTRMRAAVTMRSLVGARRERTRRQAILDLLANLDEAVIKVAEVTTHLEREGFRMHPGYASEALKRLEHDGVVHKVRYGRYAVNVMHPEITALHFRRIDVMLGKTNPPSRFREPEDSNASAEAAREADRAEDEARNARLARAREIRARRDQPKHLRDPKQEAADAAFMEQWRKELRD